jgi:nucleoside-diphosphate-sugar epimerase
MIFHTPFWISMEKILIFGASGLVGHEVVNILSSQYPQLTPITITRKKFDSPKGLNLISDLTSFNELTQLISEHRPQYALCALGTTMKTAGSKEAFFRVDHDFIMNAARASLSAGVTSFGVISAMGADPQSSFFYLKVKGQTEKDLRSLGFKNLTILRPGLLLGKRTESRPLESLSIKLAPYLSALFKGPLKKHRPIEAKIVASSLLKETLNGQGINIIENQDIEA